MGIRGGTAAAAAEVAALAGSMIGVIGIKTTITVLLVGVVEATELIWEV